MVESRREWALRFLSHLLDMRETWRSGRDRHSIKKPHRNITSVKVNSIEENVPECQRKLCENDRSRLSSAICTITGEWWRKPEIFGRAISRKSDRDLKRRSAPQLCTAIALAFSILFQPARLSCPMSLVHAFPWIVVSRNNLPF